jgi:hypothetical protein
MRHDSYHHDTTFLQSEQKQDKQERREPITNAMHIPGEHRQEKPRVGLLG